MNYKPWISIQISHAYFKQSKCGINLQPTEETRYLLDKAGILLRTINAVSWVLLVEEPEEKKINRAMLVLGDNQSELEFKLNPITPEIGYFTQWGELKGDGWAVVRKKDRWLDEWFLQVPVTFGLLEKTMKINVEIQSKKVGWEFILIPKHTSRDTIIELREDYRNLDFSPMEKLKFPGEEIVFRCTTTSNITLKEIYDYKICLWERKENGELMLSNNIPFPKPDSISVLSPKERISSYFYF